MASFIPANEALFGRRLVWMQHPSTHKWWPALKFDHAAQALEILDDNLNDHLKTQLAVQFVESTTTLPVAHFVGTDLFVHYSPTKDETLAFFKNMGHLYTSHDELKEPMKLVAEYLQQDMEKRNNNNITTGQTTNTASSSTTTTTASGSEQEDDDYDALDIETNDSWEQVWMKLYQAGWRKKTTKKGNTCWVVPGSSRTNGTLGQDYFNTLHDVQEYVRETYAWNGSVEEEEQVVVPNKKKKRSNKPTAIAGNKRRAFNSNKLKKDDGRIWGRPKKQRTTIVPSTPDDQSTTPQDPAAPRLDDESSSDDEDAYEWTLLWDRLKAQGWIAVKAGKYNILHDWYYVRPRRSVADGELGKDYFSSTEDVISFCRYQDEQDSSAESPLIQQSPRKRSRNVKVAPVPTQETTTAAVVPKTKKKAPVTKKKKAPATTKPPLKKWWFHDEAVPSFRDIWYILQHKLGFRYTGGCYKLPTGDEVFATDLDMRKYLLEHGIPNLERANNDETTQLFRWVTFVHVPVKDINSTIKLDNMQELSNQEATYILVNQLGFSRSGKDGSFHRGESESFESLQDVRDYFRKNDSLAPPTQGRRRNKASAVELSDHQVLEFRLWAALSPTPLPEFPSIEQDDAIAATPSKKTGLDDEEEQEESTDHPTESSDVAMDKEPDASSPKKTAPSEVSRKMDDDDAFEFNDENEHAGPTYPSIRISLSPHHQCGPLTQPEE